MQAMKLYAEFRKVDRSQRMVWGYASTEAEDSHGEIVTRDALAAALPDYLKFANVREMHQPSAVGVTREAELDDKGLYVGAHIVDDVAWRKIDAGVYKGFSIGGRVTDRDPERRNVITGLKLSEISLVDRPANPEAVFDLWKADETGLAKLESELAAMSEAMAELQADYAALERRLVSLEAKPLPPKAALKVVPKEADDLRKFGDEAGEPATPLEGIKKAFRHPQPLYRF